MSTTDTAQELTRLRNAADKAWRDYYDVSRRMDQAWNRYYTLSRQLREAEARRSAEAS